MSQRGGDVVQRTPPLSPEVKGAQPVQEDHPTGEHDVEKGSLKSRIASGSEERNVFHKVEDNVENTSPGIVVDWDGPDDPINPLNWSAPRKWSAVCTVGLMCFVSPLASTFIAPAAETIANDPDFMITDPTISSLIVSIFILGFALGPLIASPLSELYGRSVVTQIFMGIFFIFNVACAVAKGSVQMIVFRFLAGVGGAAPLTVGPGVISDIFIPSERGAAISLFSFTSLIGPVVGPVAGGFIVDNIQWRWCLWILVIVSGLTFVVSPFVLPESYPPVILRKKATRVRKETGNMHVTTVIDLENGTKTPRQVIILNLTRPFALLFTNAACFLIGLYLAICYGYLYLMYTSLEFVFTDRYHETLGVSGLHYIAPGLGSFFACFVCGLWMDPLYLYIAKRKGRVAIPEYRVPVMLAASFFMPVGLIIYGWTAENSVLWFWPDLGVFIFTAAILATFLAMNTYTIDAFKYAASAMAATTVMRSLAGGLFPLFGNAMFESKLGLGWGNTLLALTALIVGMTYPVFLWYRGAAIRARGNTDR